MIDRKNACGHIGKMFFLFFFLAVVLSLPVRADDSSTVTVRFLNAAGDSSGISDQKVNPGGSITLPNAPADPKAPNAEINGTPSWKAAKGTGNELYKSGQVLSYSTVHSLAEKAGSGQVLNLYGTSVLRLTYYNNKMTRMYWRRYYYEGTDASLNSSPSPSNKAYKGWTKYKGGSAVWRKFGASIKMTDNLNVYLVVYPRIRYLNKTGSKVLYSAYVKRGSTITLRQIPSLTNYRTLGWGTTKKASSADYQPGDKLKVNSNISLYAKYKYLPYTVSFTSNDGTDDSTDFTKLNMRASSGEYIKLPEVPSLSGYSALGWSTEKGATSAEAKEGASVKVTKNLVYYAVYREAEIYKVTFLNTDGSSNDSFEALSKEVAEGTAIELPAVPAKSGSTAVGWKIKINGKVITYSAGTKIEIRGNYKFYASYAASKQLKLHYNTGKVWKTISVVKGTKYTLPCMENPSGYTFMGWSKTKGMTICPTRPASSYYQAGNQVTVNGNLHLYAVLMKRSEEGSVIASQLYGETSPDTSAFKSIIFVGDSRTDRLKKTLDKQMIQYSKKNVSFVYKSGEGLSWFKNSGYQALFDQVEKQDSSDSRPIAVIFNLGVNDLKLYNDYISYMKQIAPELKAKNCRLYYMSVNPLNSAMIKKMGFASRTEAEVRKFNASIKSGLAGVYTYIDTYGWLMKTGYSTNRGADGKDATDDDGLHYTVNTYKRIYLRCLQFLAGEL